MLVNYDLSQTEEMDSDAMAAVAGGILEKEGLYPRKPGDIDYAVYVDGTYWGDTYAGHGATITGHRTDPLIHP